MAVTTSFTINFRSRARGPIQSGAIHKHVRDYEKDVAEAIAEFGEGEWLENLNSRIRIQTPFYTTTIHTKKIAWNRYKVTDRGTIYNHWLEGTGSMNAPVTIFPGYFSRADAEATTDARRGTIGRRILRQHRARGRLI